MRSRVCKSCINQFLNLKESEERKRARRTGSRQLDIPPSFASFFFVSLSRPKSKSALRSLVMSLSGRRRTFVYQACKPQPFALLTSDFRCAWANSALPENQLFVNTRNFTQRGCRFHRFIPERKIEIRSSY